MSGVIAMGSCANLGWPEIVIIVFVIALVFGAKRLPELARSMGKGLKEFKKATKELQEPINEIKEPIEDMKKAINKEIHRPLEDYEPKVAAQSPEEQQKMEEELSQPKSYPPGAKDNQDKNQA